MTIRIANDQAERRPIELGSIGRHKAWLHDVVHRGRVAPGNRSPAEAVPIQIRRILAVSRLLLEPS